MLEITSFLAANYKTIFFVIGLLILSHVLIDYVSLHITKTRSKGPRRFVRVTLAIRQGHLPPAVVVTRVDIAADDFYCILEGLKEVYPKAAIRTMVVELDPLSGFGCG